MAFLFTMAKIAHLLVIFENPFFPIKNLHDNLKKYLPIQKLRFVIFVNSLKNCQFYIV